MSIVIDIPAEFPKESLPTRVDVIALVNAKSWIALNDVAVCSDASGKVIARFGDDKWNVRPYISQLNARHVFFDFTEFLGSVRLTLELKLIVYGWLFHKSRRNNFVTRATTLVYRFHRLKGVYLFLLNRNQASLSAFKNKQLWDDFEVHLLGLEYSQGYIRCIFGAINNVLLLQRWLGVNFGIKHINSYDLSTDISSKVMQQTLTIPERIADAIYGKAIELVESAHPNRVIIANIEKELYDNYLLGKEIVDTKDATENTIDAHKVRSKQEYAALIHKALPRTHVNILKRGLGNVSQLSNITNGHQFQHYHSSLITACYICCAAFSGMRDSEINALTTNSYYLDEFEGREFHMLQSRTFKLGEKRETWVAAPIVKKAIELMEHLTLEWRKIYNEHNGTDLEVLWFNQKKRSELPILIKNWKERLTYFCKKFDIIVTSDDYQECVDSNPNSAVKIKEFVRVGEPWNLASHQFRRTLAFYTVKHHIGTSIALKQQFKHLSLQMTLWYSEGANIAGQRDLSIDAQYKKMLEEEDVRYTANKYFDFINSTQHLSGVHGKAIVAMRNDIPYIYSSWDVIYNAVKTKQITLHGTGHSYCNNGYNCDMNGVVNPAYCVNCSSSIIDPENAKWWQRRHSDLVAYLADTLNVSISVYSHCITQIRAAEAVMKDFEIEHNVYKHPIEIISNE